MRDSGDFINLEDLPAQSLKVLIGVDCVCVFIEVSVRVCERLCLYCVFKKIVMILKQTN